jgi:hypothetical protein
MHSDKVMNQPINIKGALQTLLSFGIGIGSTTKPRISSTQRGIKGFNMIGMNRGMCPKAKLWKG